MEVNHRQAREEFAVVYQAFASAIFSVRYTLKVELDQDLSTTLKGHFDEITDLTRSFVRFLRAHEFQQRLQDLIQSCNAIQDKIINLLSMHTAISVDTLKDGMVDIRQEMKKMAEQNTAILSIVSHFSDAGSSKERSAAKLCDEAGGVEKLLKDDNKIVQIANIFSDHVTAETKSILQENMTDMLQKNREIFINKLENVKVEIIANFQAGQGEIMEKLNSGPQNLIENYEFKKVWEENRWRASVKDRIFIEGSHFDYYYTTLDVQSVLGIGGHFRYQFFDHLQRNKSPRKDNWTLDVLNRVIYHPAICDAIDDDGSGYISVREFNTFLQQKPLEWTVPEWFAFWGIGWNASNYNHSVEIDDCVNQIQRYAAAKREDSAENRFLKQNIQSYIRALQIIREIIEWAEVVGYTPEFPDFEVEEEVNRLIQQYLAQQNHFFDRFLSNGVIEDDSASKILKKNFGDRVELWIMPLLLKVLKQQVCVLGLDPINENEVTSTTYQTQRSDSPTDQAWFEMCSTLEMLLYEFHARLMSLIREWKVHKIDRELEAYGFSGGIFSGWYQAQSKNSNKKIQAFIDRIENMYESESSDDEFEDDGDGGSTRDSHPLDDDLVRDVSEMKSAISKLQDSVSELQSSISESSSMMQNFISAKSNLMHHEDKDNDTSPTERARSVSGYLSRIGTIRKRMIGH
ncbi:hypothetical protein VKT23_013023 [Stygiomarasmius scandens]|uniref:EF-hand domain-containing protein n=1 Tax=Marasmiellus scandens TaxID=2682957 RepID=A0ABR1J4R6_9AGAR